MKILIADDHSIVRHGIKQILQNLNIFSIIEEATNGQEAFEMMKLNHFDFVILDISMPGLSGLDILQKMKSIGLYQNVLILSVHPEKQYAVRALRMGASGYLSKESASEELEMAIQKISNGQKYISSVISEKLAFDITEESGILPHEKLSEREFQVMCLLAEGVSVTEISHKLNISDKTVSTHRIRVLGKMGLKKNAELTLYAVKNGLIE